MEDLGPQILYHLYKITYPLTNCPFVVAQFIAPRTFQGCVKFLAYISLSIVGGFPNPDLEKKDKKSGLGNPSYNDVFIKWVTIVPKSLHTHIPVQKGYSFLELVLPIVEVYTIDSLDVGALS